MKKIDETKYQRVKEYIQQELSVVDIREKIEAEFNSSISNATIKKLRDEIYEKSIDNNLKESMKILVILFHKALTIPAFVKLVSDQEAEAICQLEEELQ